MVKPYQCVILWMYAAITASALEEFKDRDINVLGLGISIFILLQRLSFNVMTQTEDAFTSHLRGMQRMRGRKSIHEIHPASRSSSTRNPPLQKTFGELVNVVVDHILARLPLLPRHAHDEVLPPRPHSPLVPGEARLHAHGDVLPPRLHSPLVPGEARLHATSDQLGAPEDWSSSSPLNFSTPVTPPPPHAAQTTIIKRRQDPSAALTHIIGAFSRMRIGVTVTKQVAAIALPNIISAFGVTGTKGTIDTNIKALPTVFAPREPRVYEVNPNLRLVRNSSFRSWSQVSESGPSPIKALFQP